MLKFFVALLLIAGGMTESDICDKRHPCGYNHAPEKFPETEEELQEFCKPNIEYMKCIFDFEEKCWDPKPEEIHVGYRTIATLEEMCSEDTLLHAAIVDNLKCFSKLAEDEMKFCPMDGHSTDRIRQFAEALSEEGLVTLTDNESDAFTLHECISVSAVQVIRVGVRYCFCGFGLGNLNNFMNFFACHSVRLERECGTVAMDAYVDIVQKIGPGVLVGCENSYDLLPAVIRLYKLEEEKEHNIAEAFRKRNNTERKTFDTGFTEPVSWRLNLCLKISDNIIVIEI